MRCTRRFFSSAREVVPIMKRFLFIASLVLMTPLFLLSARRASADYYLIKIDINKLDLFPDAPGPGPGGSGGLQPPGKGGGLQPQGGGGQLPAGPPPVMMADDPNAKWV